MSPQLVGAASARVLGPARLVEVLGAPARRRGMDERLVVLTVLATCLGLLGAPDWLMRQWLAKVAAGDVDAAQTTWRMLDGQAQAFPYLRGMLDPLMGWLEEAPEHARESLAETYGVLEGVDLRACVEAPEAGGDLLGPVYTLLRGRPEVAGNGAFYTPASLCRLISRLAPVREGDRVLEPACGTAGMVVSQARAMRARGECPERVEWVLQDIDPTALALAGVNVAAHGLPRVRLLLGDALAAPLLSSR